MDDWSGMGARTREDAAVRGIKRFLLLDLGRLVYQGALYSLVMICLFEPRDEKKDAPSSRSPIHSPSRTDVLQMDALTPEPHV